MSHTMKCIVSAEIAIIVIAIYTKKHNSKWCGGDLEKLEPYALLGERELMWLLWKTVWWFLKKLSTGLPDDQEMPPYMCTQEYLKM